MEKNWKIPVIGDEIEYISSISGRTRGTVVEGFVVKWSDDPDDFGCFIPGERYEIMPTKTGTSIEVDFTGEELIEIGRFCQDRGITFSELVDKALNELVFSTKKRSQELWWEVTGDVENISGPPLFNEQPLTQPERMTLVCEKHKIEADGAGHKVCLTCRRTN